MLFKKTLLFYNLCSINSTLVSYTSGNDLDIKVQVGGNKIIVVIFWGVGSWSYTPPKNSYKPSPVLWESTL